MIRLGIDPLPPALARYPKIARLDALARAGAPVPAATAWCEPLDATTGGLGARSGQRFIARMAIVSEDGPESSGAGFGRSIGGITNADGLRDAIAELSEHARTESLGPWALLVQAEIVRRALVVACTGGPHEPVYVEVHTDADDETLARGSTPSYAGPLRSWTDPAAEALRHAIDRSVTVGASDDPTDVDLELVIDPDGAAWVVQSRPLVAPLCPGWPAFARELSLQPELDHSGTWWLDAEHNPAPLSAAHEWLLDELRARRPGRAGDPTAIAGWLYTRAAMLDLGADRPREDPTLVLRELLLEIRPRARARFETIRDSASIAEAASIPDLVEEALAAFIAMIDVYVGRLIPARRAAGSPVVDGSSSVTLRGRGVDVDVLPTAWDVEAPPLSNWIPRDDTSAPSPEGDTAGLLREWDDHLFALGLAPIRAVILRAAALLGLDEVAFAIRPPRLLDALSALASVEQLRAEATAFEQDRERRAALEPPGAIVDGRPMPAGPSRARARGQTLRGIGFGRPHTGPIAVRHDLGDLLRRPPRPGAIVCMPTLTAQAALALSQLEIDAVCTEHGGALTHGALVARELSLSALLGCVDCTRLEDDSPALLDPILGRLIPGPTLP